MSNSDKHFVHDQVKTSALLITLFLRDKVKREISKLDTKVGKVDVSYEIKDHAPTNYALLFTANIELWDEDLEDYLPYSISWFLDVVQTLEWNTNQDKFDTDYRVSDYEVIG
jgi:hypothetical protein